MKYTIEGFSQSALLKYHCDAIDALIFRWFVDFQHSGKMESVVRDGQVFYWISYQHVLSEMPILGISNTDVLRHRLKRMRKEKILTSVTIAFQSRRKAYYQFNPEVYSALVTTDSHTEFKSPVSKSPEEGDTLTPDLKVRCTPDFKVRSHRILKSVDPSINDPSIKFNNKRTTSPEPKTNEQNQFVVVEKDSIFLVLKEEANLLGFTGCTLASIKSFAKEGFSEEAIKGAFKHVAGYPNFDTLNNPMGEVRRVLRAHLAGELEFSHEIGERERQEREAAHAARLQKQQEDDRRYAVLIEKSRRETEAARADYDQRLRETAEQPRDLNATPDQKPGAEPVEPMGGNTPPPSYQSWFDSLGLEEHHKRKLGNLVMLYHWAKNDPKRARNRIIERTGIELSIERIKAGS